MAAKDTQPEMELETLMVTTHGTEQRANREIISNKENIMKTIQEEIIKKKSHAGGRKK